MESEREAAPETSLDPLVYIFTTAVVCPLLVPITIYGVKEDSVPYAISGTTRTAQVLLVPHMKK